MRIRISSGYRDCHTVRINGETFEDVPNISKIDNCSRSNCRYYYRCDADEGIVRIFDCKKNIAMVNRIWNLITSAVVVYAAITFYKTLKLGFFRGTGCMILTMIGLDMVCCVIEKIVKEIRDRFFYRKLKKDKAKKEIEVEKKRKAEEKKQKAEEARKKKEEFEANIKEPKMAKVHKAELILAQAETISQNINLCEAEEKAKFCISKCREIIEILKTDYTCYIRFENLLEVYLPEFFRILSLYEEFEKEKINDEEYYTKLKDIVDYFYDFLNSQNFETTFDKQSTASKFNIAVFTLRREIERRGGKL